MKRDINATDGCPNTFRLSLSYPQSRDKEDKEDKGDKEDLEDLEELQQFSPLSPLSRANASKINKTKWTKSILYVSNAKTRVLVNLFFYP